MMRTRATAERMRGCPYGPDDDIDWPIFRASSTDTYADGRLVATAVRYGEREDEYVVHVWHPDPAHPDNQVGAVIEFSQWPYPWRYRYVHVTAPGVIEVEKEEDTEAAIESLTDDERRVYEAYMMARHTDRPHRTHTDMAAQLGMTVQEIEVITEKLGDSHAEAYREEAADVLSTMGLRLSPEKTAITHIDEGIDFLGWRIQRRRKRGTSKHYVYTYPARKSVTSVTAKVKTLCRQNISLPLEVLLHRLNSLLRGWTTYFRPGVSSATFSCGCACRPRRRPARRRCRRAQPARYFVA